MKKVVSLVLILLGIAALFFAYSAFKKSQDSKNWPTTKGKVISSHMQSRWSHSRGHTSRMHQAKVQYEYSVNGKTYLSGRISFGDYSSSNSNNAKKVVGKYPSNKEVTVYYDPAKPETAILEPGKVEGIFIPFAFGVFSIVVGLLGCRATFDKFYGSPPA